MSMEILPGPAASASALPLMPAKITLATMLTWASPPRSRPTRRLAKSNILSVIRLAFISSAAKMKSGTASMTKLA